MIPVALSGDRSYNADVIRKYVISGNSTIPGASTVHFDEISKDTATPERMDGKSIYEICDYNVPYEITLKKQSIKEHWFRFIIMVFMMKQTIQHSNW